jgi:hypothetical protein
MGWWSTNKEGRSFAENDGPEMLWGDSVADIIDAAIDDVVKVFKVDVGRAPTKDELVAGFRFSTAVYGEDR